VRTDLHTIKAEPRLRAGTISCAAGGMTAVAVGCSDLLGENDAALIFVIEQRVEVLQ
jgi:hypothetical protein